MPFQPSEYSDTASTVEALAPLVISAGTEVATTAITGRRSRPRHRAALPPPPPASSSFPVVPVLAVGGLAVVGAIAVALTRKKKPETDKAA